MEPGAVLIPVLIVLSGAIALVGNAVGRNIGRRRLSLLGLRPRYTAQVITVATGMLITVTTVLVVLAISDDARVALLHLNEVRSETRSLEAEIKKQQDRLKQLALGDIVYLTNQEVARDVVDSRQPTAVVRRQVTALVQRATELARDGGVGTDSNGNTLVLTPPNLTWDAVADLVDQRDADTVVRLVASQNTLRGEPLPVFVQFFDNRLVFRAHAVILSARVDGRASREQIGLDLFRLADAAARQSRGKVLPPPGTTVTTAPDAVIDIDNHRAAVRRIVQLHRTVTAQVVATRDIYTIGPLAVSYVVVGP